MKYLLYSLIYAPLVFAYFNKWGGVSVKKDLKYAYDVCRYYRNENEFRMFLDLLWHFPEWRALFIFRLGRKGRLLRLIYPNRINFHIGCAELGGGFFPQHAYATYINANSVGERCQVWQNVTIGVKESGGGRPSIGNNVKIYTGAVVLGDITIGNNVIIGANAVVTKSVPDNSIAVGVPAIFKPIQKV